MNYTPNPPFSAAPAITLIGDIGIDLVMGPLAGWPEIGTETLMPRSEMRAGGSAGNVALALRSLGAPVRLISAIGNDPLGHWLTGQFDGIDTELTVIDTATSTSVGLLHEGGERNFFTTRGHLETQVWTPPARARSGDIVLLTGVFLLPEMRSTYAAVMQP
jgi:sugar/nucleoside kinase (ribokinase family)